jgi:hypothetical protein
MLLGIVFIAAGVKEATGHGGSAGLADALALSTGAAGFLAGTAAIRTVLRTGPVRHRLAGAVFALATVPLGALVSIEAQLLVLTAGLVVMLAAEGRSPRP